MNLRLAFVENAGPDSVRTVLREELKKAREVCIAVAFVTRAGVDQIIQPLRSAAATGSVRLLTGLYQHLTEPSALEALLLVQEQTNRKLSVRLSREPQFHRKFYLIRKKGQVVMLVGSSNLTKEGLRSGGELNALVWVPEESATFDEARAIFDKDWEQGVNLDRGLIERYERRRKIPKPATCSRGELAEILVKKAVHHGASPSPEEHNAWRIAIEGSAGKRSQQIISETTSWFDRGYSVWVQLGKSPCRLGDRVFLFDFRANRLSLVHVKDFAEVKVRNPDGQHFVAYTPLARYTRRLTPRLWAEIKAVKITKTSARRGGMAEVSASDEQELRALIRKSKQAYRGPDL
ncbi:MAG TPA: phospholipase D-like domain-containing protein [Terriglobia bacterium]|nr:phospholipase D-like domain-containing protein [Terriglobia bacterium]